jgi:hypothetical protein
MDYHLEKEITLLDYTKRDGSYPWLLREISDKPIDEDDPFVTDFVPYPWGFHFSVSEIRLNQSLGFYESSLDLDDEELQVRDKKHEVQIEGSEFITAILHPGICNDGEHLEVATRFSMFGTDRIINNFILQIICKGSGEERHKVTGDISHTWESKTEPDSLCIRLFLSKDRFDKFARLISDKSADRAIVSIKDIQGFYSEPCSVSTTSGHIKVLTENKEQKVSTPEGSDIIPPRLGVIGDFSLSLITRSELNLKQDFGTVNIEKLFEEPQERLEQADKLTELITTQMTQNQMIASKVNNLLQFICVCLVIILLSIWL